MYSNKTDLSADSNPMDVLRKYAPYLVGAGASVAMLVGLYYWTYEKGDNFFKQTTDVSSDTMDDTGNIVNNTVRSIAAESSSP
jgi:hypothetical protein